MGRLSQGLALAGPSSNRQAVSGGRADPGTGELDQCSVPKWSESGARDEKWDREVDARPHMTYVR